MTHKIYWNESPSPPLSNLVLASPDHNCHMQTPVLQPPVLRGHIDFPCATMPTNRGPSGRIWDVLLMVLFPVVQEVCAAGTVQQPAEAVERPLAATPWLPVGAAELGAAGDTDRGPVVLIRQRGANHGPRQPQWVVRVLSHQHGKYLWLTTALFTILRATRGAVHEHHGHWSENVTVWILSQWIISDERPLYLTTTSLVCFIKKWKLTKAPPCKDHSINRSDLAKVSGFPAFI